MLKAAPLFSQHTLESMLFLAQTFSLWSAFIHT